MNDAEQTILSVLAFAIVGTVVVVVLVSAAFLLPVIAVGAALWGGVYYHYHSASYLESKSREHTHALYQQARARYQAKEPDDLAIAVMERLPETPIIYFIGRVALNLIQKEQIASIPEPPLICNSIEGARYRDKLSNLTEFPSPEAAVGLLSKAFTEFLYTLPHLPESGEFAVRLTDMIEDPARTIEALVLPLYDEDGLFVSVKRRLDQNAIEASGAKRIHLPPSEYKGENILYAYLKDTPFLELFSHASVPLAFDFETRMSHMHVVGGSGAGKTQLLQNMILQDLTSPDPPSLVIVDSQGDLIANISRLALFDPETGPLRDKLIIISPKDIEHPPAINIFDVNKERLGSYDEATREQVTAGVIQTFDYLFEGLVGADLTAKQSVFFRFVARLMLALPETLGRNATILDMIALMDNPAPYQAAIDKLPPIPKQFFERDFPSKTFAQTKEQIRYRLNAILENPTLARLFTAPDNRIDLLHEMGRGSIILVDTAKDFLKGASPHFGRIFIALVLQAVLERAALPEHKRRNAFLIVDEAADYFDSNMDDLLTQARKYKVGCLFAHQFLEQCTSSLRASLAANTAIKMASGVSTSDARSLAPDLRTSADFILAQPQLHFATYIRNSTTAALSLAVPYGSLEKQPRLSDAAFEKLRARNRARVSLSLEPIPESAPPSAPPPDASQW